MSLARTIAVALALTLLPACGSEETQPAGNPGEPQLNVVQRDEIGAQGKCTDPPRCLDDYRRFITLAAAHARPTTEPAVIAELERIDAGAVPTLDAPRTDAELGALIQDRLNIGFLVDGLKARELQVITTARTEAADYRQAELLFRDPWVGEFSGLLLTPKRPGPHPAMLAVHGHDDSAPIYRDTYHGAEYPGRGYVILMLTMRAMGSGTGVVPEHQITKQLFLQGFTLMGLRVYESLLGLKYLRALSAVHPGHVGLIGHSGGSSTGNLTVRIDHGLAGYVSDHTVDYAEWFSLSGAHVYHCETVPALYPSSWAINDFASCDIPVLAVPYGYPNGVGEIFAFLDANVK